MPERISKVNVNEAGVLGTNWLFELELWKVCTQNASTHHSPNPCPSRGVLEEESLLLPAAAEAKLPGSVEGMTGVWKLTGARLRL